MALRSKIFAIAQRAVHVKSWDVPVTPGGTLKVRLPTTCTVRISPLDPHKSDWQQAKVDMEVLGESDDEVISEETGKKVASEMGVSVVSENQAGRNYLHMEAPPEDTPTAFARNLHFVRRWIGGPFKGRRPLFDSRVVLDVKLPGKFDLDVEVAAGIVELCDSFEGDVKIQSGSADVSVEKLKSMYIDIECDDGDVSAGVLQGNVSIRANAGNVDVGRAQGPVVKMVTDSGDIQTRALYASYAMLRSREGAVRLGVSQGYTKVRTVEGVVEVAGVEGRLDVETDAGDVEARLSVPRSISIRSRNGDIALGLSEGVGAAVVLEGGAGVDVVDEVGLRRSGDDERVVRGIIGDGNTAGDGESDQASVHARAPNGDVIVRRECWVKSLGENSQNGGAFPRWAVASSS